MIDSSREILADSGLSDEQRQAVIMDNDVALTAGAGSGKTRTLVYRYLMALQRGAQPEECIAITFTEKAAREMRSRIRSTIGQWLRQGNLKNMELGKWQEIYLSLDAAPIGTIHSLCSHLLRRFPVEADIDPNFSTLDEPQSAIEKQKAVEIAMAEIASDPEADRLCQAMTISQLRIVLGELLDRRLDARTAFEVLEGSSQDIWKQALDRERKAAIRALLDDAAWPASMADLCQWEGNAGDKLESRRSHVLAAALAASKLASEGTPEAFVHACSELSKARVDMAANAGSKAAWHPIGLEAVKSALKTMAALYDRHLKSLLEVSWNDVDDRLVELLPILEHAFQRAVEVYAQAKANRGALDFDDLEERALYLLKDHPDVRAAWHGQIRAVLVDEFQDTNERQAELVQLLSGFGSFSLQGQRARLFIVGDAKQSIYRFRGADVQVFADLSRKIAELGGSQLALSTTYRAYATLVQLMNTLLAPLFGDRYEVLKAHRHVPKPSFHAPFVEVQMGVAIAEETEKGGESGAERGRRLAAAVLAERLRRLQEEGIQYGQVALLFRASTSFPIYEDALADAGVPSLTVAGKGFYDRPEVRELLMILQALADPSDDAAMAAFLRSAAVGLSDVSLYRLRCDTGSGQPMMRALSPALAKAATLLAADPDQAHCAARAQALLGKLSPLCGRVPVATVLSRFLEESAYLVSLRLVENGERPLRNVEKLLADAIHSGTVSVGDFLRYVRALRDVGSREGEAPGDSEGAVLLMSVHKAKGLEFDVVALADAGHQMFRPAGLLLSHDIGPLPDIRRDNLRPAIYQLGQRLEKQQAEGEERRLLYVAATRAREMLIVNGHTTLTKAGNLKLSGWLDQLAGPLGLERDGVFQGNKDSTPLTLPTSLQDAHCALYFTAPAPNRVASQPENAAASNLERFCQPSATIYPLDRI